MATAKSPLCSCNAFLLLCMVIVTVHRVEAQCGGFHSTCQDFAIDPVGGLLIANCYWDNGVLGGSMISLDQYIGNSNGQLVDGAGFMASCKDLGWYSGPDPNGPLYLKAICKDNTKELQLTSYDLNRRVSNVNGALTFNNCRRRSLLDLISSSNVGNTEEREIVTETWNGKLTL